MRARAGGSGVTPGWQDGLVENCSALVFGEMSRLVAAESRRLGLVAPSFRSPPRLGGASRTVRRYPSGQSLVSVRCRGRSVAEVVSDMVEGVLVVSSLEGPAAEGLRLVLRAACLGQERRAA